MNDIIIVGGGPAGLTTAIYTSREGFDTLLLEKGICGGLPATTDLIENYPGFPDGVNGMQLIEKFKNHALRFGANISEYVEVSKIESAEKRIKVQTSQQEYSAYAVIVASGSIPKKLNISGEEKYAGKGVSYCATCDGPFFKEKHVAVIGCGNSGLQEGESLLRYVKSLTFIEFLPHMTGEKIMQDRLQKNEKTRFLLNHSITSINGDHLVHSVTVKNQQTGKEEEIEVSGVFIYVGFLPNSKFLEGIADLDVLGYVITNDEMETSTPGIYAAGDIRSKKVRQIDVACGEGTIAAVSARDYINKLL
jgi:thioredoxin reductase (NADPH)